MSVYISGKWIPEDFEREERTLRNLGHEVVNPITAIPEGLTKKEQMHIRFKLLKACDHVVMLPGWRESSRSKREHERARRQKKKIYYPGGTHETET